MLARLKYFFHLCGHHRTLFHSEGDGILILAPYTTIHCRLPIFFLSSFIVNPSSLIVHPSSLIVICRQSIARRHTNRPARALRG